MAIFLSTYETSVDSKNRAVVPKEFRMNLMDYNGFVAFRSYKNDAIDCFSMEKIEKLSQKIDQDLDIFSKERSTLESAVFADAATFRFDKDGRVVLNSLFLEHAKIDKKIAFVGLGTTFQIWNPDLFKEYQKNARKMLDDKQKIKI